MANLVTIIIRNDTLAPITLLGLELDVSEEYSIQSFEVLRWATDSDVEAAVLAGDLAVSNGTAYFSTPASAYAHMRKIARGENIGVSVPTEFSDSQQDQVQDAINTTRLDVQVDGTDRISAPDKINFSGNVDYEVDAQTVKITAKVGGGSSVLGTMFTLSFAETGSVGNKWLGNVSDGNNSDRTFAIIPFNCELKAITFSNRDDNSDTDVEIWVAQADNAAIKNKVFEWMLRDARVACKNNLSIPFDAGDKIGVLLDDQGVNPDNVTVQMFFKITSDTVRDAIEGFSGNFSPPNDTD